MMHKLALVSGVVILTVCAANEHFEDEDCVAGQQLIQRRHQAGVKDALEELSPNPDVATPLEDVAAVQNQESHDKDHWDCHDATIKPRMAAVHVFNAGLFGEGTAKTQASDSMMKLLFNPCAHLFKKGFPEANRKDKMHYKANNSLLKYSDLLLAYSLESYNAFKASPVQPRDKAVSQVTSPGSSKSPIDFCLGVDKSYRPSFDEEAENTFVIQEGGFDTQAAIFHWEARHEQVVTLVFRGSEIMKGIEFLLGKYGLNDRQAKLEDAVTMFVSLKENLQKIWSDWMLTDFEYTPKDDTICDAGRKAGVKIHGGVLGAWMIARDRILKRLREVVDQHEKRKPDKKVKVFITGHSLGAALAALASYDMWCNPSVLGGRKPSGTITFGQPILFFGSPSVEFYKRTVPKENRIRVLACGLWKEGKTEKYCGSCPMHSDCKRNCGLFDVGCHWAKATCWTRHKWCWLAVLSCKAGNQVGAWANEGAQNIYQLFKHGAKPEDFVACDIVGAAIPDLTVKGSEYRGYHQPDDDFQIAEVRDDDKFGSCFGFPEGGFCHLLDRYSQGLRASNQFNGDICSLIIDEDDSKKLTPAANGLGQHGFPLAESAQLKVQEWVISFNRQGWSTAPGFISRLYEGSYNDWPTGIQNLEKVAYFNWPPADMECQKADWRASLDKGGWSECPAGTWVSGLYRSAGKDAELMWIEEARCCKPKKGPRKFTSCKEDWRIRNDFDKRRMWSGCDQEEAMIGLYRNPKCGKLFCLEAVKCCKFWENSKA